MTTPSQSLLSSAAKLMKLGQSENARFARRMAEEATIWPELYVNWAQQIEDRANRISTERKARAAEKAAGHKS